MNQLVALQEIYESFSKGGEALRNLDSRKVEGCCPQLVSKLIEGTRQGKVSEDLCVKLSERLENVYEIKRLGDICSRAGFFGLAIKTYNKALSSCKDQNIRPVLLNNLGQVYTRQGDFARAALYFSKAVDGFESIGDLTGTAHVLGNMAQAYRKNKDWDKAIEHCYRSLKSFEQQGEDSGAAQMMGNLGRIYTEMGEKDLAYRYFEKSLKEFQRLGDKKRAAGVLNWLGRLSSERKDWDSAIKYYNKSLSLFEELGQKRGSGLVLSNLGKMHLEKGEMEAAREALERAVRLMGKEMQPNYQNADACLASVYSSLAKKYTQEVEPNGLSFSRANKKAEEKLKLASQYYARSSDRFMSLASQPEIDLPELKVSAGIAQSRSYLARLQTNPSEEETLALAERAIAALGGAAANSRGKEKDRIQSLQRILMGMKEAWAVGLKRSEPWGLTKSLESSIEYLLGAASRSAEICQPLCDALKSLSGAVEEERNRRDPSQQLRAVASSLQKAEKRFEARGTILGKRSALMVAEASQLLNGLINMENGQNGSSSRMADLLNYRAHRNALLLMGWVLAEDALAEIDRTAQTFAWDEGFKLVRSSVEPVDREGECLEMHAEPAGKEFPLHPIHTRKGIRDEEAAVPQIEVTWEKPCDEPAAISLEHGDITERGVGEMRSSSGQDTIVADKACSERGCLVPVRSVLVRPSTSSQLLLHQKRMDFMEIEIIDPEPDLDQREEIKESDVLGKEESGSKNSEFKIDESDILQESKARYESKNEAEWRENPLAWLQEYARGLLSRDTGIKLAKAMAVIVVLLLAIEVILYLI